MLPEAVRGSPGIFLTAEESPEPVIASNGVPFLQLRSVESHSDSGREMEGKKERAGYFVFFNSRWESGNALVKILSEIPFIRCTRYNILLGLEMQH